MTTLYNIYKAKFLANKCVKKPFTLKTNEMDASYFAKYFHFM